MDGRYYLSLEGPEGWCLLVYDTATGLWHREDGFRALAFAALEGELYAIEADTGALWALKGTVGEKEESLPWMAETGPLRYAAPDRQYLSRFDLVLETEPGTKLELWLRYDERGDWERAASLEPCAGAALSLPVRPRRCARLRLRLKGEGGARILALTKVLERGSDL